MLFGGGRQKKIQNLLAAGDGHAKDGNFAEARKAAETAFNLAAEAIRENLSGAQQAQALMVHAAVKVGDWAWAQAALERALNLFDGVGYDLHETISVRRSLLLLYERRENHEAAVGLVRRALSQFSDQHPEHWILSAHAAPGLAAMGRVDEAVETATRAFDEARKRFEKQSEAAAATCVALARVLIETGRDPATGFNLVGLVMQKSVPRTVAELITFLRDSHLQALAHFQAGNLNECAHYLHLTLDLAFKPVWEVGGYPRLLYGKLQGLHGEALAMLGQVAEAEATVYRAIREVEASAGPRSPDLIPILESHARVLRTKADVKNAEVQEKRVAAIRSLVTGRKVAPVKQEGRKAINTVWPKRTLAGVYQLKNVNPAILTKIITSMRPVSSDDTGFETIPAPGDQAFLVLNTWEKAWQPKIALVAKHRLIELSNVIGLINTGLEAAGFNPVEIDPWATVLDSLECGWEQWPPAQREKLLHEVFPGLPEWSGDEDAPRWLGEGIRRENERPRYVAPSLSLAFVPNQGLHFAGLGPGRQLDRWFLAFARATNLFAAEMYSRLSEAKADAPVTIGKGPVARA